LIETNVLIVDDDEDLRLGLGDLLASVEGIHVAGRAANGWEAIQKARELKPDLIVMDIRMPGLSGIEATRQIKREQPGVGIIILTMLDAQEYRQAALAAGADAYVMKHALLRELIPAIRRLQSARCAGGSGNLPNASMFKLMGK
jgi:DNA-binding NarL/FixJ family response regulator